MKRFILLAAIILLMSGCANIQNSSYDEIINEAVSSDRTIYNTYRTGYKFYLPNSMYVKDSKEYNETIKTNKDTYYLYIDLISYLNKAENTYTKSITANYSTLINHDDKSGYIEINSKDNQYLIEIMYNYAKIEVLVEEADIKSAIANSIIVLSSIYYNDDILNNMSKDNILSYSEENVDIFASTSSNENSNFLDVIEEYDGITEEDTVPDYDLIN